MHLWNDRRAQSVQIGAILLLGIAMTALAIYQLEGVPQENAGVEYQHSQTVENELLELRNALLRTGHTGGTQPVGIELGTAYPQRLFLYNPPPATGELATTEPRELRIENARAAGDADDVADYWDGRDRTFETTAIRYRADYNEYDGAPDRYLEHGTVVAAFDDAALLRTGQPVVDGDRIELSILTGDLSARATGTHSVDPRAISTSERVVPITATEGEDLEIVLPTAVPEDRWDDLEAEWADAVGDDGDVAVDDGTVRLELAGEETYRLRLSMVAVGETTTRSEPPAYVTAVPGAGDRAAVEVRDRFNNPVANAEVEVYRDDTVAESARTDAYGQVSTSIGDATEEVRFEIGDGVEATDVATVPVDRAPGVSPGPAAFDEVTVADDTRGVNVEYTVTYTVAPRVDFDHVEVTVRNLDEPAATETRSSTATAGSVTHEQGLLDPGSPGDDYEIEITLSSDGEVLERHVVSDVADGDDPPDPA